MKKFLRIIKLMRPMLWAAEKNHVFIYGTNDKILMSKFMKLVEKRAEWKLYNSKSIKP